MISIRCDRTEVLPGDELSGDILLSDVTFESATVTLCVAGFMNGKDVTAGRDQLILTTRLLRLDLAFSATVRNYRPLPQ